MARIAFVYDRFYPQIGGIERVIGDVACLLAPFHQVIVVAEASRGLPAVAEYHGVSVFRYGLGGALVAGALEGVDLAFAFGYTPFSPRCLFPLAVARGVLQRKIPLVWCPTYYPAANAALGELGRAGWKRLLPNPVRRMLRRLMDRTYRRTFGRSSALWALTERERQHWLQLFPDQRVRLVPQGISTTTHRHCTDKATAKASMQGRFGPGPHITSVGRFVRYKNQQVLVEALPAIRLQFPTAQLILVGPDEDGTVPFLRERARALSLADAVRFTGRVDDEELCQLYAGSACIAHPSWHEAYGLIPLEALVHGTPIVHSGNGALERYESTPGCYRVPESEAPSSWAQTLAVLLTNPRNAEHRAEQGRRIVLEQHTLEAVAQMFADEIARAGVPSGVSASGSAASGWAT